MKFDNNMVLNLLTSIIKDISGADWELQNRLLADLNRLEVILRTRGPGIVLLSMPESGKFLDKGLSSGYLDFNKLPHDMGSRRKGTLLFNSLFERIFEPSGVLVTDPSPSTEDVFALRQVLYLFKKLDLDCLPEGYLAAISDFVSIDAKLRSPTYFWSSEDPVRFADSLRENVFVKDALHSHPLLRDADNESPTSYHTLDRLLSILESVSQVVNSMFPLFDIDSIVPKHGPGAVSDRKTGTDKYQFSNWSRRLDHWFPVEKFAYANESIYWESVLQGNKIGDEEVSASLLAVPKTFKSPRLITCEPTAHQFLQQGLLKWIRKHLPFPLRRCIDFKSQEPSRVLTLKTSLEGDLATVDLSSASDRLSLWTIERLLPKQLLPYLYASRSQTVVNGTGYGEPFFITMKKFSGQGSAVTFPIQSIVYTYCCIAAVLYERGVYASKRNILNVGKVVRVFGDDLILPKSAVPYLGALLQYLELKVNVSKTHYEGHFRESCGMDAYMGEEVTPLYIHSLQLGKQPKASELSSWIDVSNNAYQKGLWNLTSFMDSKIPSKIRKLLPVSSENLGCLSLHTHLSGQPRGTRTRHNAKLHRHEVEGLIPYTTDRIREREGSTNYLQYFIEVPTLRDSLTELTDPRKSKLGYRTRSTSNLRRGWVPFSS